MKLLNVILVTSAFLAPISAQAITGATVSSGGPVLALNSTGLSGGSIATLSGGTVYSSDQSWADIPFGTTGNFLAAGPSSGTSATLTFAPGITSLGFLWGSPDTYNFLTITTNTGSANYTTSSLSFPLSNGDQSFAQYVKFTTDAGEYIKTVNFTNTSYTDAFEVSNFSATTAAVPEPATWAMMIGGFGMVGAAMRRRKMVVRFA